MIITELLTELIECKIAQPNEKLKTIFPNELNNYFHI